MSDDDKVYEVRGYLSDRTHQETAFTFLAIWRGFQVIFASWIPLGVAIVLDMWLGSHKAAFGPDMVIEGGLGVCTFTVLFVFAIIMLVVQYKTWKKYSGRIL